MLLGREHASGPVALGARIRGQAQAGPKRVQRQERSPAPGSPCRRPTGPRAHGPTGRHFPATAEEQPPDGPHRNRPPLDHDRPAWDRVSRPSTRARW